MNSKSGLPAFGLAAAVLHANEKLRVSFIQASTDDGDQAAVKFLALLPRMTGETIGTLVDNFYKKNTDAAYKLAANVAVNVSKAFLGRLMEEMDEKVAGGNICEGDYLDTVNALKFLYEMKGEWTEVADSRPWPTVS